MTSSCSHQCRALSALILTKTFEKQNYLDYEDVLWVFKRFNRPNLVVRFEHSMTKPKRLTWTDHVGMVEFQREHYFVPGIDCLDNAWLDRECANSEQQTLTSASLPWK